MFSIRNVIIVNYSTSYLISLFLTVLQVASSSVNIHEKILTKRNFLSPFVHTSYIKISNKCISNMHKNKSQLTNQSTKKMKPVYPPGLCFVWQSFCDNSIAKLVHAVKHETSQQFHCSNLDSATSASTFNFLQSLHDRWHEQSFQQKKTTRDLGV